VITEPFSSPEREQLLSKTATSFYRLAMP